MEHDVAAVVHDPGNAFLPSGVVPTGTSRARSRSTASNELSVTPDLGLGRATMVSASMACPRVTSNITEDTPHPAAATKFGHGPLEVAPIDVGHSLAPLSLEARPGGGQRNLQQNLDPMSLSRIGLARL